MRVNGLIQNENIEHEKQGFRVGNLVPMFKLCHSDFFSGVPIDCQVSVHS